MALEITYVGGFNPFEWDELFCPLCGNNHYVSISHAAVHCKDCCAQFSVRRTAGDPGCVVDCFVKEVYAPMWECLDCGKKVAFFDWQDPICPADPRHTMRKADPEGLIRKAWKPPKGFPKGFYLILKLGDYCSGWLSGETCQTFRPYPTQEQWDKFQAEAEIAWPRFGARYALL